MSTGSAALGLARILLTAGVGLALAGCMPRRAALEREHSLVFLRPYPPQSLDPAVSGGTDVLPIHKALYEQLTELDSRSPGLVRGQIARSWSLAPDRVTLDLALEPGHRFSDGSEVDAAAVVYSIRRVKALGKGSAGVMEWLRSVEATGSRSVRLHLKAPYAPAVQMLSQSAFSVVNPRVLARHDRGDAGLGWLSSHSEGSGRYRIARVPTGESLQLEPNPFAPPPAQFRRIEFRFLPDEGVRRLLLERGDADVSDTVSAAFIARYRQLPRVSVAVAPGGPSVSYIILNNRRGPLRDVRLRQAVAAAVDYPTLRRDVLKGAAIQLPGYLTPTSPGFRGDEPTPRRDLQQARRLAAEAGYRGRPLRLLVAQVGSVSEFLQANLRDAGLDVQILRVSVGALEAAKATGDYDLIYDNWYLDTPDVTGFLDMVLTSRGIASGLNAAGYASPQVDALVLAAMAETDGARRSALLRTVDARLRADRPIVMIFCALPAVAYRSDLGGMRLDPVNPFALPLADLTRHAR